jgi:hypothetical protein
MGRTSMAVLWCGRTPAGLRVTVVARGARQQDRWGMLCLVRRSSWAADSARGQRPLRRALAIVAAMG